MYKFCTVWAIYVQNLFEKRQDFMLKILKTKDSVENKEDIKKNLEKLAANNIISNRGHLLTYPIKIYAMKSSPLSPLCILLTHLYLD